MFLVGKFLIVVAFAPLPSDDVAVLVGFVLFEGNALLLPEGELTGEELGGGV